MSYSSKSLKTKTVFKNIKQQNLFSKLTMKRNVSILERFLKVYMTLKTGVMAAENWALPSQE